MMMEIMVVEVDIRNSRNLLTIYDEYMIRYDVFQKYVNVDFFFWMKRGGVKSINDTSTSYFSICSIKYYRFVWCMCVTTAVVLKK